MNLRDRWPRIQIRALEAQLPGFTKRYFAVLRPEFEATLRAKMPAIYQAEAEALASQMTVAELDAARRFYKGPVWLKIDRLTGAKVDVSGVVDAVASARAAGSTLPDPAANQIHREKIRTGTAALNALSPSEHAAPMVFINSRAGQAYGLAQPAVRAAEVAWRSQRDPQFETRILAIADSVIQAMQAEQQAMSKQ